MFRKSSLKFLEDFLNSPSPSGYEIAAAKVFREYLADCCHVTTDVMGNTIASLNEKAKMKVFSGYFLPISGENILGLQEWPQG